MEYFIYQLLYKWCFGFRSRSPEYYCGRGERPNTGLAEKSPLPYRRLNIPLNFTFPLAYKFFIFLQGIYPRTRLAIKAVLNLKKYNSDSKLKGLQIGISSFLCCFQHIKKTHIAFIVSNTSKYRSVVNVRFYITSQSYGKSRIVLDKYVQLPIGLFQYCGKFLTVSVSRS